MWRSFKKYLPDHRAIQKDHRLKWLSPLLKNHPSLWQFNCETVARGISCGLFAALIPLPLQMLTAALLSFLIRGNLPLAVAFTWLSNPITFLPLNYFIYKLGIIISQSNEATGTSEFPTFTFYSENLMRTWNDFIGGLASISHVYLIGLVTVLLCAPIVSYFSTKLIWIGFNKLALRKKKV